MNDNGYLKEKDRDNIRETGRDGIKETDREDTKETGRKNRKEINGESGKEADRENIEKISKEYIDGVILEIQEKAPLIHCITNEITVNDVANIILALGGSPTMAHHKNEVEEITSQSDCLLINLGATEYLNQIYISGAVKNVVKVFDPVGAAASTFRRKEALNIIKKVKPNVIRGNYSEISALYFNKKMARGVDEEESGETRKTLGEIYNATYDKINYGACSKADYGARYEVNNVADIVSDFAIKTASIVIASGERDIVSDGHKTFFVDNGSKYMRRITGSGCMATGVVAAFYAVKHDIKSVISAMIVMGICGQNAENMVKTEDKGVYTFKNYLMDSISCFKDISDIEIKLSESEDGASKAIDKFIS